MLIVYPFLLLSNKIKMISCLLYSEFDSTEAVQCFKLKNTVKRTARNFECLPNSCHDTKLVWLQYVWLCISSFNDRFKLNSFSTFIAKISSVAIISWGRLFEARLA